MSRKTESDHSPLAALKKRRFKSKVSDAEISAAIDEYQSIDDPNRKRDLEEIVVSTHINGALYLARRFVRGKNDEDLVSACYAAIKKSMEKFDTSMGVKFLTYLIQWVRSEIGRQQINQEFSTVRVPVHSDNLATTAYLIGRALEQKLGRKPTTEEVIEEGLRQGKKNFLWGKNHEAIPVKKLDDKVRRARIYSLSLDAPKGKDDERSGYEFYADTNSLSAEQKALIKQLRTKAEPLFEPLLQLMATNVGFVEIDCIINRTLLCKTLEETSEPLGISRERVRQLLDINLPRMFNKAGWFRPHLLSEIVAISVLASGLDDDPPSEALSKMIRLSPMLEESSLRALSQAESYTEMLDRAEARLYARRREEPLTCTSTKFYTDFASSRHRHATTGLPSVQDRIEQGRLSTKKPSKLATGDDLLDALHATLTEQESLAMMMFPRGREVLYGLYGGTHHPADIDALIAREANRDTLLICTNAKQGEALRFWPKTKRSGQLPLVGEKPYQVPTLLPRSADKARPPIIVPVQTTRIKARVIRPTAQNTPAIAALHERKQALLQTIAGLNADIEAHKATIATLRPYT